MKFYLAAPVVTDGQTKLMVDHVYEALCDAKGKENVYVPVFTRFQMHGESLWTCGDSVSSRWMS